MLGFQQTLRQPGIWLCVTLALAAALVVAACGPATPPDADSPPIITDTTTIDVNIANRATTSTREDLRATQGDTVSLRFISDEAGEVHLHGYNLTAAISPTQPGNITFTADTAGAFGLNFHIYASENPTESGDSSHGHSDDHGDYHYATAENAAIESELPISVSITTEVQNGGDVYVRILTGNWRWAPEQVDQPHAPGEGHAHIYVDGEKISRVFEPFYQLTGLAPGEHEIRVTLNSNDHHELLVSRKTAESATLVTIPDSASNAHASAADHGHQESVTPTVVVEVHLGNLEVYPR